MSLLNFSAFKEFAELSYWRWVKFFNKDLSNTHYKFFFTEYFDLPESFYNQKLIMDIGCGPRGSLEWADMAKERYGLDPLADAYKKMGTGKHKMEYIKSYVEKIPFPDAHFDIISSFNSLDHVENLEAACNEIIRVLKPGAYFLLIVDIHNYPTFTEPQIMSWGKVEGLFPGMNWLSKKRLDNVVKGRIYKNLRIGKIKKETDKSNGVLTAILQKPID
jgi:ubiquinone/menaquinone biosynthesis C-methylase UbiE